MDLNKIYSDLKNKFPDIEIYQNHPLAPYTTVKIGGPADIFIHTKNNSQFISILNFIHHNLGSEAIIFSEHNQNEAEETIFEERNHAKRVSTLKNSFRGDTKITILGNGSNVLISDSGIRGIVIKNESQEIELLPENKVKVSSGTQLPHLINHTLNHNLLGLEEFAYIPSTVGGAIAGNIHGLHGHFSDYIDSIEKYNSIIVSATLKLTPGNSTQAKAQVQETIQKKSLTQSMNSAGCTFKNPEGKDPAGQIIDQQLNLKGYSIGGAQISPLHANFIVNTGNATAKDYLSLINLIQSQIQTKFGFQFELEIKLLGEF